MAGALLVPTFFGAPAAHAEGGDSVTGSFVRRSTADPTECFAVAFSATTTDSGTSGTFIQVGYGRDGGPTGNIMIADVTCLVVSGSQAAFVGTIVYAGGFFEGFTSIRVGVVDRASPSSSANPDLTVTGRSRSAPACALLPAAVMGRVEFGDISVEGKG